MPRLEEEYKDLTLKIKQLKNAWNAACEAKELREIEDRAEELSEKIDDIALEMFRNNLL